MAAPSATDRAERLTWRLFDLAISVVLAAQLAFQGYIAQKVVRNGERLAEIVGNRFTASDGLAVWQEISNIRERIAGLPTEVPPAWFVRRVDQLEQQIAGLDEKLDEHMERHP